MNNRIITVISTRGDKIKKYDTNVSTWGELKSLISVDYNLQNLKAVENINKTVLQLDEAVLPTNPFRLFLRPDKTDSGADFATLRAQIRVDQEMKAYLRANSSDMFGKHWTQLSTEELEEIIDCYYEEISFTEKDPKEEENVSEKEETFDQTSLKEVYGSLLSSLAKVMIMANLLGVKIAQIEGNEELSTPKEKEKDNISDEERDDIFDEMSDLF